MYPLNFDQLKLFIYLLVSRASLKSLDQSTIWIVFLTNLQGTALVVFVAKKHQPMCVKWSQTIKEYFI